MSEDERQRALNSAYRFLARRAHSRYELQKKLERKRISDGAIQNVLNKLESQRFLDDRAFSMSFARDRLQRSQIGRDRMALELKTKGISKALLDETLSALYSERDELALAREALKKKQRTMKQAQTVSNHRKLADFLHRRGFSYETIWKVLRSQHDVE